MSTGLKANSDGSAAIQVGGTDVITLTSGGAATFVTSPTTVQAGTAAAPSITFSGDTNTGIYSPGADQVAIATGGTAAVYANGSQNVGVGTTSPLARLHVSNSALTTLWLSDTGEASNQKNWAFQYGTGIGAGTFRLRAINDANTDGQNAYIITRSGTTVNTHEWSTNGNERARITSGGSFLVGRTTSASFADTAGFEADNTGAGYFTRAGNTVLHINRLTDDGDLVWLGQAGTKEGSISVSGTTVSYNGGHLARYSQLLSGHRDESIVKGTVLSNLDEMCEWLDAECNPLPNEQLNRMKVSDVEGDTNVAGVFVNWDFDEQYQTNDMNIAMTGDMIIRIAQGVTVQKGDLLMSAGDGTAKPQGDDIVRSKTVAKVTSNHVTCTYEDGSYCVPCVLMAC